MVDRNLINLLEDIYISGEEYPEDYEEAMKLYKYIRQVIHPDAVKCLGCAALTDLYNLFSEHNYVHQHMSSYQMGCCSPVHGCIFAQEEVEFFCSSEFLQLLELANAFGSL